MHLKILMPCASIGSKRVWSVQSVLDLFFYAYFGQVQNALDPSKMVWTDQNRFGIIEEQGISITISLSRTCYKFLL
jgi:hypothetical protein